MKLGHVVVTTASLGLALVAFVGCAAETAEDRPSGSVSVGVQDDSVEAQRRRGDFAGGVVSEVKLDDVDSTPTSPDAGTTPR